MASIQLPSAAQEPPTKYGNTERSKMKTPLDTSEIAGLVQGFLLEKKINLARCDALELAARIKGARDLHQDQAARATENECASFPDTEISNADACLFFQLVGGQANIGVTLPKAVRNTADIMPPNPSRLASYVADRLSNDAVEFSRILREVGFPEFVAAMADNALQLGQIEKGFDAIARMIEKAEVHLPSFNLLVPAAARSSA